MKELLKKHEHNDKMDKFYHIIDEIKKEFYTDFSDFSITAGPNDDDVFLIMKDDNEINECHHVAVQLNLKTKVIQKFTRDHDKQIKSLLYNSMNDILITGGMDNSICAYNCTTKKLIKRVFVDKGIIYSLMMKFNILFVGCDKVLSMYSLDSVNKNNKSMNDCSDDTNSHTVSDVILIEDIEVSPQTDKEVHYNILTNCGHFDLWMGGMNSNKIYRLKIDKERSFDYFGNLNVTNSE